MKRIVTLVLALTLVVVALTSCGGSAHKDISGAKTIQDLKGATIGAQAGTFHADAAAQIKGANTPTYPEFADLLTALKSGAIDGYVAEEPTALAVCGEDSTLDYIHFVNNDTGFKATDADVGIAVGLIKGSSFTGMINDAIASIPEATKQALMAQMVNLAAGKTVDKLVLTAAEPTDPIGTLKIAMECAYEPFNWTDLDTPSLGAVPIYNTNGTVREGAYANGYDVQIAHYIACFLNMKLEVYSYEWDSLIPAVQSRAVDGIIAGMSPTEERAKEITFSNVYYSSNLVVIYKKGE